MNKQEHRVVGLISSDLQQKLRVKYPDVSMWKLVRMGLEQLVGQDVTSFDDTRACPDVTQTSQMDVPPSSIAKPPEEARVVLQGTWPIKDWIRDQILDKETVIKLLRSAPHLFPPFVPAPQLAFTEKPQNKHALLVRQHKTTSS